MEFSMGEDADITSLDIRGSFLGTQGYGLDPVTEEDMSPQGALDGSVDGSLKGNTKETYLKGIGGQSSTQDC